MDQQKPPSGQVLTAAILVIGDEVLSGRTSDANTALIARTLAPLGIDVAEVRIVPDSQTEIVAALNALRVRYTYVFTTGGIGPTHDDVTADAVAAAFNVGIDYHPEALALLAARYGEDEFNDMRKRMARVPGGAELVKNPVSGAPGFRIANVFVLAGVPRIAQAMLEEILPTLPRGTAVQSVTIEAAIAEGRIAPDLTAIQKSHPRTAIGSYPFYRDNSLGVQLVVRGRDGDAVEAAACAIVRMLKDFDVRAERVGVNSESSLLRVR